MTTLDRSFTGYNPFRNRNPAFCEKLCFYRLRGLFFNVQWPARRTATRIANTRRKGVTEPVALSSTVLVGFPLPRTTSESGFVLLALRARCTTESTVRIRLVQGGQPEKSCSFREKMYPHFHIRRGILWIAGVRRREGASFATPRLKKLRT